MKIAAPGMIRSSRRFVRDMSDFNATVIAEFRANAGQVGGMFAGSTLLLLHTKGARSGKEYVNPLAYLPDGDRYVIFASNSGADTHPAWYHNILANPETTIEVGGETLQVRAVDQQGAERDRLFARQAERTPAFGEYQRGTSRTIPVITLEPLR